MPGIFYCGDNLEVLKELPSESVDLIYIDPPFNSKRVYNIVYEGSGAQEEAFKDHWSWEEAASTFSSLVNQDASPKLRKMLEGLYTLLIGDDADLLAYLTMMAPRLSALHRVLKPTGSFYLHCDPTASHYLKVVLDGIFGIGTFQNEISWRRSRSHNDRKLASFGAIHDVLLFYAKSKAKTFNKIFTPRDPNAPKTHDLYVHTDGKTYRKDNPLAPGKRGPRYTWNGHTAHYRYTQEESRRLESEGRIVYTRTGKPRVLRPIDPCVGSPLQDVWTDVDAPNSGSKEMLGYPTQKPLALLKRIVLSSSNPGDLVLDAFCGCGTAIEACESLDRSWIGIDIARKAVEVTEARFAKLSLPAPDVRWYPPDMDAAKALAKRSGLQFEEWIRRKLRATKRSRDRGIDGEAFYRDAEGKQTQVLISVKSGKLNPAMVRELRGTIEREKCPIGVLVTLLKPTREMTLEATRAGFIPTCDGEPIPRLQLLTVDAIFSGGAIRAPGINVTGLTQALPRATGPTVAKGKSRNQAKLTRKAV